MNQEIVNNLYNLLPELTLALTILILILLSAILKNDNRTAYYIYFGGLLLTFGFVLLKPWSPAMAVFSGLLVLDPFAYFGKIIIIISAIFLSLAFYKKGEYTFDYVLYLAVLLCSFGAISSANLIMTFTSLLFAGLMITILLSKNAGTVKSYYIYFSVSSALTLYGFSLLYGMTASADYYTISSFLSVNPFNLLTLSVSVIMITAGLCFHMHLFPFNLLLPGIGERISFKNLGWISVIPLITGVIITSRLLLTIFHDTNSFITSDFSFELLNGVKWDLLLAIVSAASIIAGNVGILWQTSLKKMYTFIIIAQSGFILSGLSAASPGGLNAAVILLIAYVINSAGLLLAIKILSEKFAASSIDDIKGLGINNKILFGIFSVFLISSAGFPMTFGFTSRLYLYSELTASNLIWIIAIGILSSITLLYFIFRLIYSIYAAANSVKSVKIETPEYIILLILLIPAILLGFYLSPVLEWVTFCSNILKI